MNKEAYIQGYLQKEAEGLTTEQMASMAGAALGLSSGLLGNFALSKLLGYEGSWKNYLGAGLGGAVVGGSAGAVTGNKISHYQENPKEFIEKLREIEESPKLAKWHKWQKKSPLMRPVRQTVGRVVTNVKNPRGYEVEDALDAWKKHGHWGSIKKIIKDEPLYATPDKPKMGDHTREGKTRAYWDLKQRENLKPLSTFLKQTGDSPKHLTYRDDTDEAREYKEQEFDNMIGESPYGDQYRTGEEFTIDKGFSTWSDGMGGVYSRPVGDRMVHSDTWDFHTKRKRERPVKGKIQVKTGPSSYSATSDIQKAKTDAEKDRAYTKDSILHYLRNIGDRLIGNPVTVTGSYPRTLRKADITPNDPGISMYNEYGAF